ncbi:MAG: hypothetical protein JO166_10190 [Deltaproteobacteria bacterium]|nr:hypothetical protein [Deltaproteobacteria bacterium]
MPRRRPGSLSGRVHPAPGRGIDRLASNLHLECQNVFNLAVKLVSTTVQDLQVLLLAQLPMPPLDELRRGLLDEFRSGCSRPGKLIKRLNVEAESVMDVLTVIPRIYSRRRHI